MVLIVISSIRDNWGGSEELWAAMAEEALSENHSVVHLSYEHKSPHPKMKQLINHGLIEIHRPGYYPDNITPVSKKFLILINYLKKKINPPFKKIFSYRPDIILYVGTAYSIVEDYKLVRLIRKYNSRFFINVQLNEEYNAQKPISQNNSKIIQAFELCKKILFVSQRNKDAAEMYLNYKFDNASVIRNPVNMPSTEIIPYPQNQTIQFAIVGNLICKHKGQDIALEALSSETWRQRNWHLNIYGSGTDEALLKEMTNKLNLQQRVTFHGRVTDIRSLWQQNHLLLMPSRMEGMPLAVVEAMLCGRPCVVTDVGGHSEWIEENKEGFIATEVNPAGFAAALEKAWQQKENWMQLGINAHNKAMQLYDPNPGKTLLKILIENVSANT